MAHGGKCLTQKREDLSSYPQHLCRVGNDGMLLYPSLREPWRQADPSTHWTTVLAEAVSSRFPETLAQKIKWGSNGGRHCINLCLCARMGK